MSNIDETIYHVLTKSYNIHFNNIHRAESFVQKMQVEKKAYHSDQLAFFGQTTQLAFFGQTTQLAFFGQTTQLAFFGQMA
jgi:hypothetical protein